MVPDLVGGYKQSWEYFWHNSTMRTYTYNMWFMSKLLIANKKIYKPPRSSKPIGSSWSCPNTAGAFQKHYAFCYILDWTGSEWILRVRHGNTALSHASDCLTSQGISTKKGLLAMLTVWWIALAVVEQVSFEKSIEG